MRNDRLETWLGAVIVLAVLALTAYVVTSLGTGQAAVTAAVLTAVAAMLAALPAVIKALRGGGER